MRILEINRLLTEFPLPQFRKVGIKFVLDEIGYVRPDNGKELEAVV